MTVSVTGSRRLLTILRADAAWDFLLGVVVLLAPWPAIAGPLQLPMGPWPIYVAIGLGCLAFAWLLARVGEADAIGLTRIAAIANAVAVVVILILVATLSRLGVTTVSALVVAAVGCAAFAVLEWRACSANSAQR